MTWPLSSLLGVNQFPKLRNCNFFNFTPSAKLPWISRLSRFPASRSIDGFIFGCLRRLSQLGNEGLTIAKLKGWAGPLVVLQSPWDNSNAELGNLDFFPPLDYATRHTIQLLQELNAYGFRQGADIITLDRCKHLLKGLLNHHRKHGKGENDSMEQCAYRAHAILQNMQVFWLKETRGRAHSGTAATVVADWPLPDREVFILVLQIFQRTSITTDLSFPRMAQSIVDQMNARFSENGDLECKTEPLHWNSVLMSWSHCTDWQRSVHAATETFQRMTTRDASSFVHMMLSCSSKGIPQENRKRAAELGAQVAARLWKKHITGKHTTAILEGDVPETEQLVAAHSDGSVHDVLRELPSHFYAAFLQAIRNFPDSTVIRVSLFDECFQQACMNGKLNAVILNEFIVHVKSEAVMKKHLGPYLMAILGKSPGEAAELLMNLLPRDWIARTDDKTV